jgi:hypothetical protein
LPFGFLASQLSLLTLGYTRGESACHRRVYVGFSGIDFVGACCEAYTTFSASEAL